MVTFRIWLIEVPLAAFNCFVLIERLYTPRVGRLRAHQIGMSTRIVWIFALASLIVDFSHAASSSRYLTAGAFWVVLWLAFEWIGSFITRRPLQEILAGWHIERGYMWPYVLLDYLVSPLLVAALT